eukprot:Skav207997  [mRNA]  locus=scaffold1203:151245:151775:+ [translate_table: standard]
MLKNGGSPLVSITKDDWDEDAPARIEDPAASMPAGWLEEEPLKIADPKSKRRGPASLRRVAPWVGLLVVLVVGYGWLGMH